MNSNYPKTTKFLHVQNNSKFWQSHIKRFETS